jgi:hypothetical protein
MKARDDADHQPAPTSALEAGANIVSTRNPQLKTPRLPGTCPPEKAIELEEEKTSTGTPFKIVPGIFKKIN